MGVRGGPEALIEHRRFHAIADLGDLPALVGRRIEHPIARNRITPHRKICLHRRICAASLQLRELSLETLWNFWVFGRTPVLAFPRGRINGRKSGPAGKGWATWHRFSGGFFALFSWHLSSAPLW
jgi:hypothetical protein